jgi:hypothetical protein
METLLQGLVLQQILQFRNPPLVWQRYGQSWQRAADC